MQLMVNPAKDMWPAIIQRPNIDHKSLHGMVDQILKDVKKNGDAAVRKYNQKFDGVQAEQLLVNEQEVAAGALQVNKELKESILLAKENIEKFHSTQKEQVITAETTGGVFCWRRSVAIEKVGLYIPGGTAPLFSTLLMLGIPAVMAGCKVVNICTPPGKDGKINPVILFAANLLGLKTIYKAGGVQAIAAMAYGTESISSVHKIFGPGNQYVTAAKQMINSEGVAIDMPAGPSEVAIYADETCEPAYVAADLLSQAEHGVDSQVVLIANSGMIIERVQLQIDIQLKKLSRQEIIKQSLQNSRFIVMQDTSMAFELLNMYAPEHLIIASVNAEQLAEKVVNAGSVFLGNYASESVGDYASGTNHTLPTNGFAKAYSGVSLDSFVKKITFQKLTKEGLKGIGKAVELMAEAEGLDAHRNAISIRLNNI